MDYSPTVYKIKFRTIIMKMVILRSYKDIFGFNMIYFFVPNNSLMIMTYHIYTVY